MSWCLKLHYVNFPCLSLYLYLGISTALNVFLYFPLQVEEIYNFSQDDLLTEDLLIFDTRGEVFIWVGQTVDSKEKQSAFEIGQVKY